MPKPSGMKSGLCFVLAACLSVAGYPARAEEKSAKVDLALKPPEVHAELACDVSPPSSLLSAKWTQWDGVTLSPDRYAELRLDGKRLASFDAKRHFEVGRKIFSFLRKVDDQKVALKAGIDYARLFIDAEAVTAENAEEIIGLLSRGPAARNPTAILLLGVLHERGMGVPQDLEKALAYYRAAAQYGQADALFRLAQFKLNGRDVGLDLKPELLGLMAFSGMLKNEVPDPCSGIKRIARLYAKGTGIIRQDHQLATAWFRLAADAGDPDSAWTVAFHHLIGEGVAQDKAVLRKYLRFAAENGIVLAMVELARAYEDGSIFAQDTDQARIWYEKAALKGSFAAKLRLASMLGRLEPASAETEQVQAEVAAHRDAPPASLVNYAETMVLRHGRTGAAAALPVLGRAVEAGDPDGIVLRASLQAANPAQGGLGPDLLPTLRVSAGNGDARAAQMLASHYGCRSEDPLAADYARAYGMKVAEGRSNLGVLVDEELSVDVAGLDEAGWLERLALLRTAAIRDMPDALALLVDSYEIAPEALRNEPALAYWKTRMMANSGAVWRYSRLISARQPDLRRLMLKTAADLGSAPAAADLVNLLMEEEGWNATRLTEALAILEPAVQAGNGMALSLARQIMPADAFDGYVRSRGLLPLAAARGDAHFAAVLSAATGDPAQKASLRQLSAAMADCTVTEQFRLAELAAPGDERRRVLGVLRSLAPTTAGEQYRLGRLLEAEGETAGEDGALALYQKAAALGHSDAARRALKAYVTPGSALFSAQEVIKRVPQLLAMGDTKQMFNAAEALHRAVGIEGVSPEIAEGMKLLYLEAAEQGHAGAMRVVGLSLQRGTFTPRDPAAAATWLEKAAAGGDRQACRIVARAYLLGFGVPRSVEQSLAFYRKGAELGDKESARMIDGLAKLSSRLLQE